MKLGPIMILAMAAVFGMATLFLVQDNLQRPPTKTGLAPAIAAGQVPMKTIVVAAKPLRFGTEVKQEHLKEVEWPTSAIPGGTFESIFDLLTAEGRRAVPSRVGLRGVGAAGQLKGLCLQCFRRPGTHRLGLVEQLEGIVP
jgi:Flp pilus assembly protein CpaB